MKMVLLPVNKENFEKAVAIRFNNINEGFNTYCHKTIEGSEEQLIDFINKAFNLNGADNSYVDFYYNILKEEDQQRLKALISAEDRLILENFEKSYHEKKIYFKLTKESIPFITRLSTREILFSTIYFTKYPCTIWGNYNKRFPIFYKNESDISNYLSIENELKIL